MTSDCSIAFSVFVSTDTVLPNKDNGDSFYCVVLIWVFLSV